MFNRLHLPLSTQLAVLWLGQALTMAVLGMSLPYWPLYLSALGDFSTKELHFWSAAIYVAPFLTAVLSAPFWGKLGDKYGYKRMVIRACLGLFVTQTMILFSTRAEYIFIARLLQGALAGFIVSAQAWALSVSPSPKHCSVIGKLQSATAIGTLMGPVLGGMIASWAGYQQIFSISAFICAGVTILFICCLQQSGTQGRVDKKTWRQTLHEVLHLPAFMHYILVVILLSQLARMVIMPTFALFVTQQLDCSDFMVGILYAATGLMIFIAAPYWGKFFDKLIADRDPYMARYLAATFAISACLQLLHSYVSTPIPLFLLRCMWGICLAAILPTLLRVLVLRVNIEQRGTFLGLGNSASKLGDLIGISLGSVLVYSVGFAYTFLVIALLYFLGCIMILTRLDSVNLTAKEYVT